MAPKVNSTWQTIRTAAIAEAETVGCRTERQYGLRANLFQLAESLGIDRIEEHDIPSDGMLVARPDQRYTVFLQRGVAVVRQRFSLAHEIAHVLLRPFTGGEIQHRGYQDEFQDPAANKVEHLCNQMAAAILMPHRVFREEFKGTEWSALGLGPLSREFGVSFDAISRRFIEVAPEPCVLANLAFHPDGELENRAKPVRSKPFGASWVEFKAASDGAWHQTSKDVIHSGAVAGMERVRLTLSPRRGASQVQEGPMLAEFLFRKTGAARQVAVFVFPQRTKGREELLRS